MSMSFLILGLFTGLIISSFLREFTFRQMSGYSLLSVGGAVYGEFIYMFLNEIYGVTNMSIHALLLFGGAIGFIGVKLALKKLHTKPISLPPLAH